MSLAIERRSFAGGPETGTTFPRDLTPEQRMVEVRSLLEQRVEHFETKLEKRKADPYEKPQLNAGEQQAYDEALAELRAIDTKLEQIRSAAETRRQQGAALGAANPGIAGAAFTSSRGGQYTPESRHSYFLDLYNSGRGDSSARERLDRHSREFRNAISARGETRELRAISSTNGAGGEFIPPLWLVDDYIAALRPGRATADVLTNLPLPGGTDVINVPKVATGTATAIQANQNTQIQQTDLTTTTVAATVYTVAGGQQLSVQLFDQSPVAGTIDRVIQQDLLADYNRQVGNWVLNGTGVSQPQGLANAAATVITYTDASPAFMGAGKLYGKIGAAIAAIQTTRFAAPTAIVMHPRRWAWAATQVDTAGRAVILPDDNGPLNASGIAGTAGAQGVVGRMFGLPVVLDPNIPTNLGTGANQDEILVLKADDSYLYESTVRAEVFPQTYAPQLTLFARLYNYMALAHRTTQSIAVITGTGLITPAF